MNIGELGDSAKATEITGALAQARMAQVSDLCLNTITFSECASTSLGLDAPITPLRVHYVHYVCLRVKIIHNASISQFPLHKGFFPLL